MWWCRCCGICVGVVDCVGGVGGVDAGVGLVGGESVGVVVVGEIIFLGAHTADTCPPFTMQLSMIMEGPQD